MWFGSLLSSGPCLFFSHTELPLVLRMQCFLWAHGWPFSLPGLLSAAPSSSGRCSLLAHLSQLAYSYSLAFPQESLTKGPLSLHSHSAIYLFFVALAFIIISFIHMIISLLISFSYVLTINSRRMRCLYFLLKPDSVIGTY